MLRLVTANLNYSSWSMRAWLALEAAGAEYKKLDVGMFTSEGWRERVQSFSGAGKVPILVDGNLTVHESLAICEYLSEKYPAAELWPEDPALRARGRALSCEMLSGFTSLRQAMPTNLRARAAGTPTGGDDAHGLARDIARVFDIFEASMATSSGDFLLGKFSVVDCMYMPVVSRFRTYGVELTGGAAKFADAIWAHPLVRKLEREAAASEPIPHYDALLA